MKYNQIEIFHNMKVLVVEDENSIREVTAAYLTQAGFKVYEAETGDLALDLFKINKPDLVVLDINLPGRDGISVCKEIRRTSMIPIIMLTARVQEIDELVGLESGADDYVKKPFSPAVLVMRVKNLLKRRIGENIKNKFLKIDPDKMSVEVKKKKISFTTTEFNLLHVLASNPGKVYTRYELIENAFPQKVDVEILDRTVDAHIKNLRKKLSISKDLPEFIITMIGKGYKFNEELA